MITDIVLTAEKVKNEIVDYEDMSTDVIVHFDNGDKYIATFFSYRNLKHTLETDMQLEGHYTEHYYKILNMVLVKDFNSGDLHSVIEHMISEGDFQLVFKKL